MLTTVDRRSIVDDEDVSPPTTHSPPPTTTHQIGFEPSGSINHTAGAIVARDEDRERVDMYMDHLLGGYPVMKVPFFGTRCAEVSNLLVKNFYRHPVSHSLTHSLTQLVRTTRELGELETICLRLTATSHHM